MKTKAAETELPPTETPVSPSRYAKYRLEEGQETIIQGRSVLVNVSIEKPKPTAWFRTAENTDRWIVTPLVDQDGDLYLLDRELAGALGTDSAIYTARLIPYVTDTGKPAFWPIKMPRAGSKVLAWTTTALEAADRARTKWTRISANMRDACYNVFEASFDRSPEWPSEGDDDLLDLAFGDRIIEDTNHPVIARLQGRRE
jgi:hypothetical protein